MKTTPTMTTLSATTTTTTISATKAMVAGLALAVIASGTAHAQERLWRTAGLDNDSGGGAIGSGLDLDGDGIGDVVSGGIQSGGKGVVQVYSGIDGALLYELLGEKVDDHFGISVAMVPDLDGDGAADFIVGANWNDWKAADAGSVYVYSGLSGSLIDAIHGQVANANFGARVAITGDVDGDGVVDLLIGAPHDSTMTFNGGALFVVSGATRAILQTIYGTG